MPGRFILGENLFPFLAGSDEQRFSLCIDQDSLFQVIVFLDRLGWIVDFGFPFKPGTNEFQFNSVLGDLAVGAGAVPNSLWHGGERNLYHAVVSKLGFLDGQRIARVVPAE